MKRSKTLILAEFIEGLNMMEGAAGHMAHHSRNAKWFAIRDMVGLMRDGTIAGAVTQGVDNV